MGERMKYTFIYLGVLLGTYSVQAQMIDTMSALAVQGALTRQSTQSAVMGLSVARRTQVLSDVEQTAMEIKTGYFGNYESVSRSSVMGSPFSGLDWTIGPDGAHRFYIQLNQIDKQTCSFLMARVRSAVSVFVNGKNSSSDCAATNTIKFVFD